MEYPVAQFRDTSGFIEKGAWATSRNSIITIIMVFKFDFHTLRIIFITKQVSQD